MSYAVSITQDGTRLETAGKYVDQDIVVGMSDSIKKAAQTYTPTTSDQTIAAGQYLSGAQTIKGDENLLANNIKQGVSIFGVNGNLTPGITPSGTKNITENGTYDVTQFASAAVAVRNGTHNLHFEVTNPTSVVGAGNYFIAVSGNTELATARSYNSLLVMYRTEGTVSCVKCAVGLNEAARYPIGGDRANHQAVVRYDASSSLNTNGTAQPLDSTDDISIGSGRIFITENGDLRIYGNTNAYPIPAGKITIDVLWEDD